jgi:hypothetical protein
VLAILAAVIGGSFVVYQSGQSTRIERQRRLAKFGSVRATLPLILSELLSWTRSTVTQVQIIQSNANSEHIPASDRSVDWHILSNELIRDLREMIEFSDNPAFELYVRTILSKIQICRARLESLGARSNKSLIVRRVELDHNLYDLVDLSWWIEGLLAFARHETDIVPAHPEIDRLATQISIYGLDGHEILNDRIARTVLRSEA